MGNITGRTYIINRRFGIDEMYEGEVIYNYCIAIHDINVPRTDSVVAIKQMIEGEELTFRKTANRFGSNMSPGRILGFENPFRSSLLTKQDKTVLAMSHYYDEHYQWLRSMNPHRSDEYEWTPEHAALAREATRAIAREEHPGLPWI